MNCPVPRAGYRIHTSAPGVVALRYPNRLPSRKRGAPRPEPVPAPERGSRGPAPVLAAAPDRAPGQAPAVRPAFHRLQRRRITPPSFSSPRSARHRKSGMGPRLRGDDPRFREGRRRRQRPAQPGCRAHPMHALARCVHAVALAGGKEAGSRSGRRGGAFRRPSARVPIDDRWYGPLRWRRNTGRSSPHPPPQDQFCATQRFQRSVSSSW